MKLSQCETVIKTFMQTHPEYHYHYFENISTPQERHLTQVEEMLSLPFPYFSLMILKG
jgi:precorrin-2/cobalt-factor-2 C20-methyltransferase